MVAIKILPQLALRKGKPGEIEEMPQLISTFAAHDQAEIMHTASLGAHPARENAVRGLPTTTLDHYRTNQLASCSASR